MKCEQIKKIKETIKIMNCKICKSPIPLKDIKKKGRNREICKSDACRLEYGKRQSAWNRINAKLKVVEPLEITPKTQESFLETQFEEI